MKHRSAGPVLALVAAAAVFAISHQAIEAMPKVHSEHEMEVAPSATSLLLMAAGDRHLAANIATFRAVTVGVFELKPETYQALAAVQLSAARLNPKHEDNYYTAAAILPWNGQYAAAQQVLAQATQARPDDPLPPFFHGFDRYQFEHDYINAANDLRVAAARSGAVNQKALNAIASRWYERGDDPRIALNIVQGMVKEAKDPQLKGLLKARTVRLQGLVDLTDAANRFRVEKARSPASLDELTRQGYVPSIPQDPLGIGYTLDAGGTPRLAERKPAPQPQEKS